MTNWYLWTGNEVQNSEVIHLLWIFIFQMLTFCKFYWDVGLFSSRGVLKLKSAMDTPHPKNNGERKSWVSGNCLILQISVLGLWDNLHSHGFQHRNMRIDYAVMASECKGRIWFFAPWRKMRVAGQLVSKVMGESEVDA
jgi:hypothetical protein